MESPCRPLLPLIFLLFCFLGGTTISRAASPWHVTASVYPAKARELREQGEGIVRVSTDGKGRIRKANMVKSTGSKILDDATLQMARSSWQGPPNSTTNVPIEYRLPAKKLVGMSPITFPANWNDWNLLPKPAYPSQARADGASGSGVLRISTNDKGQVVRARMILSTGNSALDESTTNHALEYWSGPRNSETNIPVTYRLVR